jgi:hypothetical protein
VLVLRPHPGTEKITRQKAYRNASRMYFICARHSLPLFARLNQGDKPQADAVAVSSMARLDVFVTLDKPLKCC